MRLSLILLNYCSYLLLLLLLLSPQLCLGHYVDPGRATAMIEIGSNGEMRTSIGGGQATCTFVYAASASKTEANPKEQKEEEKPKGQGQATMPALINIVGPIRSTCASKVIGYWTYEVCLGKYVRQYHATEDYSLGKFEGDVAKSYEEHYTGGALCSNVNPPVARSAVIQYSCLPGSAVILAMVAEPKPCQYVFRVATSKVCDVPGVPPDLFPVESASIDAGAAAGQPIAPPPVPHQDWALEISKMDRGLLCQARLIDPIEQQHGGENVFISEFHITLEWTSEYENTLNNSNNNNNVAGEAGEDDAAAPGDDDAGGKKKKKLKKAKQGKGKKESSQAGKKKQAYYAFASRDGRTPINLAVEGLVEVSWDSRRAVMSNSSSFQQGLSFAKLVVAP